MGKWRLWCPQCERWYVVAWEEPWYCPKEGKHGPLVAEPAK